MCGLHLTRKYRPDLLTEKSLTLCRMVTLIVADYLGFITK